jgi:hypothetical protein
MRHHLPIDEAPNPDYFRASPQPADERYKNTGRVIYLAEALFNLQDVGGFPRLISDLRKKDVESTVAEIEGALILHAAGIPFAFVKPIQQRGKDYDLEIRVSDGSTAAAEIKCKVESTKLSEPTVMEALERAEKQLPIDKPCFLFMKIPEAWNRDSGCEQTLTGIMRNYFGGTSRITTVFVWWEMWITMESGLKRRTAHMLEVPNPNAKFGPGPIKDLAKSTRSNAGPWNHLPELIRESVDVVDDGSIVRYVRVRYVRDS